MKTVMTPVTTLTFLAASVITTTTAMAETQIEDTNGNGTFDYIEMSIAFPKITAEEFTAMDLDEDGEISAEELQAAYDAEVLAK